MKVEVHTTLAIAGKREGTNEDVVVPISDIEIRLNPKQLNRIVNDLGDLDPSRTCKVTQDLIVQLKYAREQTKR